MEHRKRDKRLYARCDEESAGRFSVHESPTAAKSILSGTFSLENLGMRGARLRLAGLSDACVEQLLAGEVHLRLQSGENEGIPLNATATVRWAHKTKDGSHRVGVQFTRIL